MFGPMASVKALILQRYCEALLSRTMDSSRQVAQFVAQGKEAHDVSRIPHIQHRIWVHRAEAVTVLLQIVMVIWLISSNGLMSLRKQDGHTSVFSPCEKSLTSLWHSMKNHWLMTAHQLSLEKSENISRIPSLIQNSNRKPSNRNISYDMALLGMHKCARNPVQKSDLDPTLTAPCVTYMWSKWRIVFTFTGPI